MKNKIITKIIDIFVIKYITMKATIIYNSLLTVEDNAIRNNVSVATN